MLYLPYEVICNGTLVGRVANMQLAKVLVVALMDNVNDIQSLSIQHIAPPKAPVVEPQVTENE